MSIQVEPHDSSDFTARQQVFVRAFPETIGTSVETESHYRWKFHSKKAQPPSYEYSVKESGKLIGYYAAIPYVYSTPQGDFCAGMVCDVMTDPAHQGKGVFTKAGRFATEHMKEKGIDVTTGFPIRSEVIPGHLKVGWKALFPLPIYARVTGVETLPVLRKFPKVITRFFAVILRFFSRALELGRQGDFEMVEYSSIGQIPENELNALVKKWSKLQPIFLQ
jgi:GNAT superfamily N-acetyltransferase